MQSDVRICINDPEALVIVDLKSPNVPVRHKNTGSAGAVMHPAVNIIALKGQGMVQIYNLDIRQRMKSTSLPDVEYLRWISIDTLALVTRTGVYHWSLEGEATPQLMFERPSQLAGAQIINYRTNEAKNWLLLQGVTMDQGHMKGTICLYSVDKRRSQVLDGHTALFVKHQLEGKATPSTLFCLAHGSKLHVIDVSAEDAPFTKNADIFYPPDMQGDVPVCMEFSERYGILMIISGFGTLFMYDLESCELICMQRITQQPIFSTVPCGNDGLLGINKGGSVIKIQVDPAAIIPYVTTRLRKLDLAIKIASRANLAGTEDLFREHFENLFRRGDFKEAARIAATSPQGCLRTEQTIACFKSAPTVPPNPPPLIQYFSLLLDRGQLNSLESLELVMPVFATGRKDLVENWLRENKLTCSEELGDFVRRSDLPMALAIYLKAECSHKVVQIFAESGDYDKIIAYSKTVGYQPDYLLLLRNLAGVNPKGASEFAIKLATNPEGPLVDAGEVMELFYSRNMIPELTALMIDVLGKNDPADSKLQTRFLEILLQKAPNVADAVFGKNLYSQYDRTYIAQCCEKALLYQRALEHYTDLPDILRCVVNTTLINPDFLLKYFGSEAITPEMGLECLRALLKNRQNVQIAVEIGKLYSGKFGPREITELFEGAKLYEGMYSFLGFLVPSLKDREHKDLVFKFIVAAAKVQKYKDIERVIRESEAYDPKEVKDFLKEAKIDPACLIALCDKHGFVEELTKYLYDNNMHKAIEGFVTVGNPARTPLVIGALIDLDCNEDFIRALLAAVRGQCPIPELVAEVERRNRLKMLQAFLEARVSEDNNTDPALHSALAKIYIDTNSNADQFLQDNMFYDTLVVGRYCEKRDPHRAVIAYRRGKNDDELVEVTNRNQLFKAQARYLVERQSPELWAKVLQESNEHRRALIDSVVSTALPQSKTAEEVSTTVKAFMTANLPNELIELLEKIMLRRTDFSSNKNLQNLLIITAIRAAQSRVKEYIQRLDNYDGPELAKYAIKSKLYEEAFEMYRKFQKHNDAVSVLIEYVDSIERAQEYALAVKLPEVWSTLASGQLRRGLVAEAIESYIKADDPSKYEAVVRAASAADLYKPLVPFLQMARKLREPAVDSELCWAYAKTNALGDLDELVAGSHQADLQAVGERCFEDGLFQAARSLFTAISNFPRLASTLLRLEQYPAAVEAARKAMAVRTWKEVCFACVEARQFRLAQTCGVNIVVQADELEELIRFYTERGHFDEILGLLEYAIGLERTHMGMYTELGILYSRFRPEKLMDYLKMAHAKLNIPQLLRVCEQNLQWAEVCFLYCHYDEYDYAASTMIAHASDAWNHQQMKEILSKIANLELYYRAVDFYLQQHPTLLCDLLNVITTRVDHARLVAQLQRAGHLPLIKSYLLQVQPLNQPEINEALNGLFIEEEDHVALRASIEGHPAFDQTALARRLEGHDLLEMRRIAAWLYKENKRWAQSTTLSKKDALYADAMRTAAASQDPQIVEELLRFFADEVDEAERAPCFAACLYTCYDSLTQDLVMEVAWTAGLQEYSMPYMIQVTREYAQKVDKLTSHMQEQAAKKEDQKDGTEGTGPPDAQPEFVQAPPPFYMYPPPPVPFQ